MTNSNVDKFEKQIRDLLQEAYNDGFAAGQLAMQSSILQAAGAMAQSDTRPMKSLVGSAASSAATEPKRAPYGLVGKVVEAVLAQHSGLTIGEIEELAIKRDSRVMPKSIPNELHRKKDDKYRQDGNRWYLLETNSPEATAGNDISGEDAEKEAAGPASTEPADPHYDNQGGLNGPALDN